MKNLPSFDACTNESEDDYRSGFDETDEAFNTFLLEMASQASAEVIKEVTDTPEP